MNETEHWLLKGSICFDITRKRVLLFGTSCQSVPERLHIPASVQDLYNHSLPFCRVVHFPTISTTTAAFEGEMCEGAQSGAALSQIGDILPSRKDQEKLSFSFPHASNFHPRHFLSLAALVVFHFFFFFASIQYYTVKLSQLDFHKRDIFRGILPVKF